MRTPPRCALLPSLALVASCSVTEPEPRAIVPLEPVPFDQLGSGTLVFFRTWYGSAKASKEDAVYAIDADTRESRVTVIQLAAASTSASRFAVSPNGDMLAYAVERETGSSNSRASLVVSRIDGSSPVPVATLTGGPTTPRWTPDGQRIVYVDFTGSRGSQIKSVSAAATLSPPVTLFPGSAEPESCSQSAHWAQGPVSVSDAGALLFACHVGGIYVLDAGATTARLLYTAREQRYLRSSISAPTWSPDGRRFVFLEEIQPQPPFGELVNELRVFDMSTGTATTIATVAIANEWRPAVACWMADGQRIAYANYTSLGPKIHVIPANGGTAVRITSAESQDGDVSCTR